MNVRPDPRTAARAGSLSLGLLVGFFLLGYGILRVLDLAPAGGPATDLGATSKGAGEGEAPRAGGWRGTLACGPAELVLDVLPLHEAPEFQRFRSEALRERLHLFSGQAWRLIVSVAAGTPGTTRVRSVRVGRADGGELVPLAEAVPGAVPDDPLFALLAAPPGELEAERASPLLLWGPRPRDEELPVVVETDEGRFEGVLLREELARAPRWYAGGPLDQPGSASAGESELAALQRELDRERARRAEREKQFTEFGRLLSGLAPRPGLPTFPGDPGAETTSETATLAPEGEPEAETDARAVELGRSLQALMRLEGLRGLDLLEPGTLRDGALGPVVFRLLDERGLLAGSLRAERLHLEASRAAHTLTLVLEDGHESRGGERVPFSGGVRRIALTEVDPEAWLQRCPELFPADASSAVDDGRWDLGQVKRELNRLLALESDQGWFRLHSFGGVSGVELVDVHLEEFDSTGHLRRRFFADRLHLVCEDGGVVLELDGGAILRGDEKQPFRDGTYRIVLPGAAVETWRAAELPGLAAPPRAERASDPAPVATQGGD